MAHSEAPPPSTLWHRLRDRPWQPWGAVLLLLFAVVLCYANSLRGEFIYDDFGDILANPSIRRLWPLDHLFVVKVGEHWHVLSRPIPNLTFAINHALGGLNPYGFHLTNVLIHLGATLALFGLIRKSLSRDQSLWPAFLLALWWGIHPLQTESVAYITQRYESVMGLFVLLGMLAFATGARRQRPGAWHGLGLLFLLLAMMSKEVAVGAPLVILLYDRAFQSGSFREALRRHRLFYGGALLVWAFFLWVQVQAPSRGSFAGYGLETRWWQYAQSQPGVVLHYLRLALIPHPLVFDYMWPAPVRASQWVPQSLVILGLLATTFWALVRHPRVGFLLASIWIFLAPTSSILPILDRAVEHRMYLSLAPVLALLGWGLAWIYQHLGLDANPKGRLLTFAGGAVVVALLGVGTVLRNTDYHDQVRLWADTAQKRPINGRAWVNLGYSLEEKGQLLAAEAAYRTALKLDPEQLPALPAHNLGALLMKLGRPDYLQYFELAVRQSPSDPALAISLVRARMHAGQNPEALELAKRIRGMEGLQEGHYRRLAGVFQRLGERAEAEKMLRKTLAFDPYSSRTLWELAHHLLQSERPLEAMECIQQALRYQKSPTEGHLTAAWILQINRQDAEASHHLEQAMARSPLDPRPLARLAWLKASSPIAEVRNGRAAEALALQLKALQGAPLEAQDLLAAAKAEQGAFDEATRILETLLATERPTNAIQAAIQSRLEGYQKHQPYRMQQRPFWFASEPPPAG